LKCTIFTKEGSVVRSIIGKIVFHLVCGLS
jgi:hypothetical protein